MKPITPSGTKHSTETTQQQTAEEVNFDGLVGPTHHYGGLAFGNLASMSHAQFISYPKEAAIQGLKKMHLLMSLGIRQAILPPHERPNLPMLRSLGFAGKDETILEQAFQSSSRLFSAIYSASAMWTANAATVSPSSDTADKRLHITPANLITHFHRAQETELSTILFQKIFSNPALFQVHPSLPAAVALSDEGAANHLRFSKKHGSPGVELFVYGRDGFMGGPLTDTDTSHSKHANTKYPARQTREASEALMRRHLLHANQSLITQQNPLAINEGVFHNDVISVANENVFFYHEEAFVNTGELIESLKHCCNFDLFLIPVSKKEISLHTAVHSYLFNSQIVTDQSGKMILIAPAECEMIPEVQSLLKKIVSDNNPIRAVHYVDLRQSMQNGGGPACLRLRVILTAEERQSCLDSVFLTDLLYHRLLDWVEKHFRDRLTQQDLLDPLLIRESQQALDELSKILKLGNIYSFQT